MRKIIGILTLVIIINSCGTGMRVSQEYDKDVDFNQYKTYSIYPWNAENGAMVNRDDQEYLVSAVAGELRNRGYKRVDYDGDLIADIYVIMNGDKASTAYRGYYTTGYWGGYFYQPFGFGFGAGYATHIITEGTVIVNVFDKKAKKLVWHSQGKGPIEPDPQYRAQAIPKYIAKVFYKFPKKIEK